MLSSALHTTPVSQAIAGFNKASVFQNIRNAPRLCLSSANRLRQQVSRLPRRELYQGHGFCTRANGIGIGKALSWGNEQLHSLDRLLREVEAEHGTADPVQEENVVRGMCFPVDLRESEQAYQCAMDLPGMDKQDVQVCLLNTAAVPAVQMTTSC